MSDPTREFQEALDKFVRRRVTTVIFPAIIQSVDLETMTCDVRDLDDHDLFDVRLRADTSDSDGWILVPSVGSSVLVADIGNSETDYCLVGTSTVNSVTALVNGTRLEIKPNWALASIDTVTFQIKADGLYLKKGAESLKKILDDLIDQVNLLTVTCAAPGAPSTVPLNSAAFTAIRTRVDNLLK